MASLIRRLFRPRKAKVIPTPVHTGIAQEHIPPGHLVMIVGDKAFGISPNELVKPPKRK